MKYNYSVEPMKYVHGYCATKCETLESALTEYEYLEENTPICWAIVPLNDVQMKDYKEKCAILQCMGENASKYADTMLNFLNE